MLRKSKDETRRVKQIPTDVKIPTIRNEMAVFIFEMYIPKSGIFEMNFWGFFPKHNKNKAFTKTNHIIMRKHNILTR